MVIGARTPLVQAWLEWTGAIMLFGKSDESSTGPAAKTERRVWVRYPCERDGFCQPPIGSGALQWAAKIEELSSGGLALVVDRRFEPGTLLSIEMQHRPDTVRTFLARVVHLKERTAGRWLLGCSFAKKLNEEELNDLLRVD
jgi:hypothetical protein